MFKNVAGQKLTVFAFDSTTNLPKTGDAANITAYYDLDDAGVTVLTDASATEKSSSNAAGYYIFDLAQAETNGDKILFSAKSSTTNIVVVAVPSVVYTTAPNSTKLSVDSNGRVDVIKIAGTTQTAKDVGGAVPAAAAGASGGLLISGTNSGGLVVDSLTVVGGTELQSGMRITQSQSNERALLIEGNGSGEAIGIFGGLTGNGVEIWAGDNAGVALQINGVVDKAVQITGGDFSHAVVITGGSDGDGLRCAAGTGAGVDIRGNITGNLLGTVTSLTNAPTAGDFTATMKTSLNAATPAVTVSDKTGFSLTSGYDPAKTAAQAGDAMTLTSGERNSVADALLDRAAGVETNRTPRQALRLMLATLAGKLSGAAGTTVTIRDTNDTVNRVVATVDADGNRSAVTLDAS